ncbi:MAG: heavy-metal-associated domain-containing protein [Cytophagales bacterium]|nr:heavy-metal-associated domain-containing protein [Cytophagales bacterium]
METLKFKTNINCSSCVSQVTPALDSLKGIESWDVDIHDPKKILTVRSDSLSNLEIITKLISMGFTAEPY